MHNLSIVLITYNRSEFLDRTLGSIADSPFAGCEIWVLNNASTDPTLDVCAKWRSGLPGMQVITHKVNIGGRGNILRAYEYGTQLYKWILCDDDELHFEQVSDLLKALESHKYDLIRIGQPGVLSGEAGKVYSLRELLLDRGADAYWSFTFLPGLIFRSDFVAPNVIFGYDYVHTFYMHFFVLLRSFGLDASVYTTSEPVLFRGTAPTGLGSEICVYWLKSLEALPDRESKSAAARCFFRRRPFNLGILFIGDLLGRRSHQKVWFIWKDVFLLAPARYKLIALMNMPFVFIPVRLLKMLYSLLKGKPYAAIDVEELRLARKS
jgi:glycosyltransferase involved in cell wall biosynthesis